jgi:hypothetical protein
MPHKLSDAIDKQIRELLMAKFLCLLHQRLPMRFG